MKIACNKCETVEDKDRTRDWLRVRTDHSEFMLCPRCLDGFWMAIDSLLPHIVPAEQVIFLPGGMESKHYEKIRDEVGKLIDMLFEAEIEEAKRIADSLS